MHSTGLGQPMRNDASLQPWSTP